MIRETSRNADLVRTPRTVFTWSVTDGLVGPSAPAKETCEAPLDALGFVARHTEPAVFVFKDFHVFFGNEKREQDHTVIRKLARPVAAAEEQPETEECGVPLADGESCRSSWRRRSRSSNSTCPAWARSASCCAA